MRKISIAFLSIFLLTSVVRPQKAEASIILIASANVFLPLVIPSVFIAGSFLSDFDDSLGSAIIRGTLLVADEKEDSIRNEILSQFPNITNESLQMTSRIIIEQAEEVEANQQGLKEIAIDSDTASALTELADFESQETSDSFYELLTTQSLQ